MMEGKLTEKKGKLYVLYTSDEYSEPFRQHLWWRVLELRGTGYGERPSAGDLATSTGGGGWSTRNPSTHRSTGSVSIGAGSTQAELVERTEVLPPKVSGKQLRWHDGRWEKLMAKGWMPAGEGKAIPTGAKSPSKKRLIEREIAEALEGGARKNAMGDVLTEADFLQAAKFDMKKFGLAKDEALRLAKDARYPGILRTIGDWAMSHGAALSSGLTRGYIHELLEDKS